MVHQNSFTPFQGDRDLNKGYTMLPVPTDVESIMNIEQIYLIVIMIHLLINWPKINNI